MKKILIAALCASQLAPAAQAAELGRDTDGSAQRRGAFAGARFRVPLGGRQAGKPQVGLALAPVLQSRGQEGMLVTRYGQGLELGLAGRDRVRLSFAGRPVSQFAAGSEGPRGRKMGVSTVGWVAIGVGVIVVTVATAYVLCGTGAICNFDDE